MLSKLTIENYALINHLEIDFQAGFSVITGETGAGKSILLGAISLLLGNRVDNSILLDKSRKCIVEGTFQTKNYNLEEFFIDNQLDQDETTILRREINQTGKSRAFINDTPVNIGLLKALGDRLVNIHSQHSIITLNNSDFQIAVVDSYAENSTLIERYRKKYRGYLHLQKELEELTRKENQARAERDYQQFLYEELLQADLREGEQEESEQRLALLTHAEEIKTQLQKIGNLLTGSEQNILDQLSEIITSLQNISRYRDSLKDLGDRLQTNFIDLKDISREFERIEESVQLDPGEIESRTSRLDLIYRLEKKHSVMNTTQLNRVKDDLAQKLLEGDSLSERIGELTTSITRLKEELHEQAGQISSKRQKSIPEMEKKIAETLQQVGIPDARIRLELSRIDHLSEDGFDKVRFLFSGNKGIELNEISRIASGGEQSRLMLSIKSLISMKNLLPTIILDEIDSGVSGNVAGKVASILKRMGKTMQVIAITHLPQIAGQGETHYRVYKTNDQSVARTHISKLTKQERIKEIAMMLSNNNVTPAAMKTAQELILS